MNNNKTANIETRQCIWVTVTDGQCRLEFRTEVYTDEGRKITQFVVPTSVDSLWDLLCTSVKNTDGYFLYGANKMQIKNGSLYEDYFRGHWVSLDAEAWLDSLKERVIRQLQEKEDDQW